MKFNPVYAEIRVGYVDLRKALNAVEDGRKAKSELQSKKDKFQQMLNKKQTELKREKELFDSRTAILRGDAKQKAQVELQKKFFSLQQLYTSLTQDLAKEEAVATRHIFQKMEVIIQQIARENNLYLMLEKTESSVLYALPGMDYTDELVRRYNRIYGKGGKAKTPPTKKGRKPGKKVPKPKSSK
jgi:Skp family chaperone for outer membrane proteins